MTGALLATVALIGLAGTPHCAGMCGALCSGAARACGARSLSSGVASVLVGRLIGYALAGAAAASIVMAVRWLSIGTGWMRPLWSALQFFMLCLGLWLVWRGRLPAVAEAWLERKLNHKAPALQPGESVVRVLGRGELQSAAVGVLWPLIPCGLLQSALLMASMASGPAEGALLMVVFGATSMLGVLAGAFSWGSWLLRPSAAVAGGKGDFSITWPVRLTGAVLVISAGWTLLHGMGLVEQAPWCA